jgi:hypothetical protein
VTFFLFSVWAVLFGPATETCTYVVIAPTIAWMLLGAFARPGEWATRLAMSVSLLLMGPLPTDLFGSTVRNFANEHGSQPIGACILGIYLAASVFRVSRYNDMARRQHDERLSDLPRNDRDAEAA